MKIKVPEGKSVISNFSGYIPATYSENMEFDFKKDDDKQINAHFVLIPDLKDALLTDLQTRPISETAWSVEEMLENVPELKDLTADELTEFADFFDYKFNPNIITKDDLLNVSLDAYYEDGELLGYDTNITFQYDLREMIEEFNKEQEKEEIDVER